MQYCYIREFKYKSLFLYAKLKYDIFKNSNEYNKGNIGEIFYNNLYKANNEIEDENNDIHRDKKINYNEKLLRRIKERNFYNKKIIKKSFN